MKAKWDRARWVRSVRRRKHAIPLDEEVIDLCVELNNIPNVKTFSSCSGHGKTPLRICLTIGTPRSAVILAYYCSFRIRSLRHYEWNLGMRAGRFPNSRQLWFVLEGRRGRPAYRAAKQLAEELREARENDYQDAVQDESW